MLRSRMASPALFGQSKERRTSWPASNFSMSASVQCSSQSPLTCAAGPPPQAPRHSTRVTTNRPSCVTSPSWTPSFRQVRSIRPSAPLRAQDRLVQISTWVLPQGRKRNIA